MIIIFSESNCQSTNEVVEWLSYMNEKVIRINGDEDRFYLKHIDLTKGEIIIDTPEVGRINVEKAKSVWYRRDGISSSFFKASFNINELKKNQLNEKIIEYLHKKYINEVESLKDFIYGISYRCKKSIGNYFTASLNKIEVLNLAQKHGLSIPNTLISNNFIDLEKIGGVKKSFITKAIDEGIYFFDKNYAYYSYTEEHSYQSLKGKKIFFSLFQNKIEKDFEIRSFFLLGEFYSMAIISQNNSQTEVDFRKYDANKPNRMIPFKLPTEIEEKLELLLKELNLNTGSVDLVKDKDGNYIFLEINPVGQFGMVENPCNYPLHKILAESLI